MLNGDIAHTSNQQCPPFLSRNELLMQILQLQSTLLTSVLLVAASATSAFAGTGDSTTEISPQPESPPSNSSPPQQVIQLYNSGSSSLTYPHCSGACVFAIGRLVPATNGTSYYEAVAGVMWQLNSPEKTQAQAIKMKAQAESDRINQEDDLKLAEKLADAIENKQESRANIFAMLLAKRLGYKDHRQLLQEVRDDMKAQRRQNISQAIYPEANHVEWSRSYQPSY